MSTVNTVNSAGRSYLREFGSAMLAYSIAVPVSLYILQANPGASWRVLIALLPVVPALFALWAFVRYLGRTDELQRRIQLEGLALGFGGAGILTFSYGFLENVGFPHLSYIYVFPLMIALWGVGVAFANRRFR